jgi:hypothetical protein
MPAKRIETILLLLMGGLIGLAALLAAALQSAGLSSRQAGLLTLVMLGPVCLLGAPRLARFLRRRFPKPPVLQKAASEEAEGETP